MCVPTWPRPWAWSWRRPAGDNQTMELNEELQQRIQTLLSDIEELDPAEVPSPAAELAALLGEILEGTDESD